MVRIQRLESAAIFVLLLGFYYYYNLNWVILAIFILLPDISMVGYLKNPKLGAAIYNLGHNYFSPIVLFGLSVFFDFGFTSTLSIVWMIHIALDRMLGFGLKLPTGFKNTHLGKLQKKA